MGSRVLDIIKNRAKDKSVYLSFDIDVLDPALPPEQELQFQVGWPPGKLLKLLGVSVT